MPITNLLLLIFKCERSDGKFITRIMQLTREFVFMEGKTDNKVNSKKVLGRIIIHIMINLISKKI